MIQSGLIEECQMNLYFHNVIVSRAIVIFVLFCFSLNMTVSAAMISTFQTVTVNSTINSDKVINRTGLEQQLAAFGVAPEQIQFRLDSMTDMEIAALSAEISELPAGGDALSIIAIVFLVLLFTDIAGYTDLFPFVKKTGNNTFKPKNNGTGIDRRSERKSKEPIVIEN